MTVEKIAFGPLTSGLLVSDAQDTRTHQSTWNRQSRQSSDLGMRNFIDQLETPASCSHETRGADTHSVLPARCLAGHRLESTAPSASCVASAPLLLLRAFEQPLLRQNTLV